MTDNAHELGLKLFGEIYGEEQAQALNQYVESGAFGSELARWAADFAFGTVWTRPGLERKMRSCAVLGMVIALRQSEEIKFHTVMGMANGLTKGEIEEILNSTVPYAGLPAANVAKAAMLEAFSEIEAGAGK
jgi:alkylhydroperoxidase/carboxymuconolactone decarboxylase family protein YurZ